MNRLFVAIKEKKKSWRTTRKSWSNVKHARAFKKRHSAVSRYRCYFLKCKHQNVIWDSISKKKQKNKNKHAFELGTIKTRIENGRQCATLVFFIYIYNKMIPMFSKRQKKKKAEDQWSGHAYPVPPKHCQSCKKNTPKSRRSSHNVSSSSLPSGISWTDGKLGSAGISSFGVSGRQLALMSRWQAAF